MPALLTCVGLWSYCIALSKNSPVPHKTTTYTNDSTELLPAMKQTILLLCAVLLSGFVVSQGCRCTFAGHLYLFTSSCEEASFFRCQNQTVHGRECVVISEGSMYVDCLAQHYHAYNSSDCSGPVGSAVVPDLCLVSQVSSTRVKWNEDCNGEPVPVENSEECEPVREPEDDEACFVSMKVSNNCSGQTEADCLGNWWLNHNECKALPGIGSVKADCVNRIALFFGNVTDCTGPAVSVADDLCFPVEEEFAFSAKWGETCEGEPREESDDTEDGEESSQNDGSEGEGDGSSCASSLRFDLLF